MGKWVGKFLFKVVFSFSNLVVLFVVFDSSLMGFKIKEMDLFSMFGKD